MTTSSATQWSSGRTWSCGSAWTISSASRCFSASTIRAEEAAGASELFHLTGSKAEEIDVVMTVDEVDVEKQRQALDCYVTYQQTIEEAGARRNMSREAVFELYQETYDPPLSSLVEGL